jgi:hypothetical protein
MDAKSTVPTLAALLRCDAGATDGLVRDGRTASLAWQFVIVVVGAGLFGAALGAWRSPEQALFTALKFPLIILLTTAGNALLNGMLAPLLGVNLRFRESLHAVALSFTVAAAILGSLAPVMLFLVWNAPAVTPGVRAGSLGFELVQLAGVVAIAFGGITGVARLLDSLARLSGSRAMAWRVVFAWLVFNLLLGAQLAWNLRPFIGAPEFPVEFLRPHPFAGNFFEAVFASLRGFFSH